MTLLNVKAKNHPQQTEVRGALDDVDDRRTPPDLLAECAALARVSGFSLDVAANAENAKAPRFYTREDDGLRQPWHGVVWCNPPYSNCEEWVLKAWHEHFTRRATRIAMLLPANRTEQGWWQDHVEPFRGRLDFEVYFLRGRRRFDRPGWEKPAKGDRPPFGLCLLVWERQ